MSSSLLFLPVTVLQIVPWLLNSKFYANKKLYIKLLFLAIKDALVSDFSKSHQQILAIVDENE